MNARKLLPLASTLALASCAQLASTLNEPIESEYNPLDGPSAPVNRSFRQTGPSYRPGQWVETVMPNATFFNKIPRGSATADKVLSLGSPLKIISTKDSFLKVELEGGSVGYIPAIMVAEPSETTDTSPFLPPPPSAPLQRSPSESGMAPPSLDATTAPLQSSGGSLIPPPKSFNSSSPSSTPAAPEVSRSPTEVVIPTTAPPSFTPSTTTPSAGGGVVPPPSGLGGDAVDQSIGIE